MQCLRDAGRRKDRLRQQRLSPRGVSFADAPAPSSWPPYFQIAIPSRLTPIWLDEHGQEFVPVPEADGDWRLVPVLSGETREHD